MTSADETVQMGTDERTEVEWRALSIPLHRVGEREVRHLATLADTVSYRMYLQGGPMAGFWGPMVHGTVLHPCRDDGVIFSLTATGDYFTGREVVRVTLHGDGSVRIAFGGWMDAEVLGTYRSVLMLWARGLGSAPHKEVKG